MAVLTLILIIWGISALVKGLKRKQAERDYRIAMNARRIAAVAKEQERLAKESTKHEAMLARQAEKLAKLQFSIEQADRDIEFLNIRLDDLLESLDAATNEAQLYHNSGDAVKEEKAKRKIVSIQNQIHTTENKLSKAEFNKAEAERKLKEVA